jgi:diguanylate cyclase (GGDEF)-like protein
MGQGPVRTPTADLRHRATHDPLTDLANRAAVDRALAQALTGSCDAALLLLDLDGFEQVDDDLGHAAGDLLLLTVADRLRAVVRSGDLVARLGGDEFVVLLRGPDAAEHGPASARRILDAISAPVSVRDRDVTVGVGVGLACARPGTSADQLPREADADTYRAKHRRKVALASS